MRSANLAARGARSERSTVSVNVMLFVLVMARRLEVKVEVLERTFIRISLTKAMHL